MKQGYASSSVWHAIAQQIFAGLLLAAVRDPNPVVFLEAKMLYRTVMEDVPVGDYTLPLGQARIARPGQDITLVGWGQQVAVLERAVRACRVPFSLSKNSQRGTPSIMSALICET